MRHAVIDAKGNVVNVILWDGVQKWAPKDGHTIVQDDHVNRGDTYDATKKSFTRKPNAPAIPKVVPAK